jgi:imidazolonepropionase-like amidohydrolase
MANHARSSTVSMLALCAIASVCDAANTGVTIFRHASVLPMDRDVVLADWDVVVRGERIVSLTPDKDVHITGRDTVIDATGKFLLPGLVDFHTHPSPTDLVSDVYYGVTTIGTFDGELLQWHEAHVRLPEDAPNVISTTRIMDGPVPTWLSNYTIGEPGAVPAILDRQVALGASMAKVYSQMTLPVMRAIVEQAHLRGMAVAGHVPHGLPMDYVLGPAGLDIVAHSEELTHYLNATPTDAQIADVVAHVARNDIAVIPDLVVIEKIPDLATHADQALAGPGQEYLAPEDFQESLPRNNGYADRANVPQFVAAMRRQLTLQEVLTKRLAGAGVLLVTGTDAPVNCLPGEALHEELQLLAKSGLGNYAALRTATFNPGIFVAAEIRSQAGDRFGVIAPGARADLLLVDGNPLQHLSALERISGSMVAGHWRPQQELVRARAELLPVLQKAYARVEQYERFMAANDIASILALLDATKNEADQPFSPNVLSADALALASRGRQTDAIELLTHAERLLPESIAVRNTLGEIALRAGKIDTARQAFGDTLRIAPHDWVAEQGLRGRP